MRQAAIQGPGSGAGSRWSSGCWHPIALLTAGALVYANSLSGPFVLDDGFHILGDASIQSLPSALRSLGGSNRPVVKLTLAFNHAIGGFDVTGYHVFNVAIHLLAGLALFGVIRRTLRTGSLAARFGRSASGLAFAAALIWLVHPLATQAVTYLIQRGESLMGLFYLSTLYCSIRHAGRGRAGWAAAAVCACAMGMATKEVMVTAPLLVLAYDRTFLCGSAREALWRRPRLYLGLAATWGVLFGLVGSELLAGSKDLFGVERLSPAVYASTQPGVIIHYLRLSLFPHPLCFDYGWPAAEGWREIAPPAAVVAALGLATAWGLWRRAAWAFPATSFFLVLGTTSSVVPLQDVAAEHRMYLPLAAVVVLCVMASRALLARLPFGHGALAAVLVISVAASLGSATVRRNGDYRSARSLWSSVVETAPGNPRGHNNLGLALAAEGDLEQALHHHGRALEIAPRLASAHNNLGLVLAFKGRLDESIPHYLRAVELRLDFFEAHFNLGKALAARGRHLEALDHYRRCVEIDPKSALARRALAEALGALGQHAKASRQFRRALQLESNP